MASRIAINTHRGQENITSMVSKKSLTAAVPLRRGALGDLGNTEHASTINSNMGPPMAKPKKKFEVAVAKKEKKTVDNKENVRAKPKRQESIPKFDTKSIVENTISEKAKGLIIYDPDEETKNDPQLATEYVHDIMAYFKQLENQFPINEKFLKGSRVTSKMRAMLVNWLIEVHYSFKLELDTLYLCVSIVDRYVQLNNAVDHQIYQLVGATALFLAAKYEEVCPPELSDYIFICDDAYAKRQMLRMETDLVKKLDFRMGWPISIYFLRRYSKIACSTSDQHNLSKYILELALLEYSLAHVKPSIQAAAACCLSIAILNEVMDPQLCWTPTLIHYVRYRYSDFKNVLVQFAHLIKLAKTSKHGAVREKYSKPKFNKISLNNKLEGPLIRKLTLTPL